MHSYIFDFIDTFSQNHSSLWVFVLIGIIAITSGKLVSKLGVPSITGQIIIGILVSEHVFGLFDHHDIEDLKSINQIALGIMTFVVGCHLNWKHLHNSGQRIVAIALFDLFFTFLAALIALILFTKLDNIYAPMLAAIAVATAPGTVIHLVQAKKARGALVKTVIGSVALNNVGAILLFEICKAFCMGKMDPAGAGWFPILISSLTYILDDFVIGICLGYGLSVVTRHSHSVKDVFTYSLLCVLVNIGICHVFPQLSYLLICLSAGVAFTNTSYHVKQVLNTYEHVCDLLFAAFFTLAGAHLDVSALKAAGLAGAIYVGARLTAKICSPLIVGRILKIPKNIYQYIGLALLPQAGLAIGLIISLGEVEAFHDIHGKLMALVLTSVVVNELIGPLTTAKSFDLSRETGQSLPRLIDFMHEEFILMPMKAKDKWDAIDQLSRFMIRCNHIRNISFEEFRDSVVERENKITTGIGEGLAIPHASLSSKGKLTGVIGIVPDGVDFDSIDNKKVDIIVLVATPKGNEQQHLQVLATVSKIFGLDQEFHRKIITAANAAEVYDLLQSKEIREINYFLEDVEA